LSVLYNYFDGSHKIIFKSVVQFLDTSAKSFFLCTVVRNSCLNYEIVILHCKRATRKIGKFVIDTMRLNSPEGSHPSASCIFKWHFVGPPDSTPGHQVQRADHSLSRTHHHHHRILQPAEIMTWYLCPSGRERNPESATDYSIPTLRQYSTQLLLM